jgi:hypothetical protein
MADEKPSGLFITDDAGNVYYLRPEILAQAKMADEDVKRLKDEMAAMSKGKVEEGELSVEDLNTVAGGSNVAMMHHVPAISPLVAASSIMHVPVNSTVMCPW